MNDSKLKTLDYHWITRNINNRASISTATDLAESVDLAELVDLTDESFKYLKKHKKTIDNDLSLKTVTSLCNCVNVNAIDQEVYFLSHLFNQIINSKRKLHKCYDCGTNARAIFLKLVAAHRGKLYISPYEQKNMKKYYPHKGSQLWSELLKFKKTLLSINTSAVFICSIGINGLGHVWIFEKLVDLKGNSIVRHYQSALRSHLSIDFIKEMDYGQYPTKSIDLNSFIEKLIIVLSHHGKWTPEIYTIFYNLFRFKVNEVIETNPSFCWTFIQY